MKSLVVISILTVILLPFVSDTPILIMDACSKSGITFICTLQVGKETLQWVLSKSNIDIINDRIVYLSGDRTGLEMQYTENDLHIEFKLTSRSPFTSTLTANSSNLIGTIVFCLDDIDSLGPAHRASIDVHGHPILRLDTCSESAIHFICTVNQSELQWEIDFLRGPEISSITERYFSSDTIIESRRDIITNRATTYSFNLISTSPLTSTMTTNASSDLNGAMVTCQDGFTNAALKDTIILHGPSHPCNLTIVTSTQTTVPGDPHVNVMLQWDDQQCDTALNLDQNYTITIYPPTTDSGTVFHTSNTSIQLTLVYDQDYNISVVASNCIGNSTQAEIHIRIIDNCSLIKDDILTNHCLSDITTAGLDEKITTNESTNDSNSDLGPQQHDTVDPLVPSMIVSHLLLSAFSCFVGIFIGCLLYRYYVSKKTEIQATSPPEPLYTEISLSANEAYGKINR